MIKVVEAFDYQPEPLELSLYHRTAMVNSGKRDMAEFIRAVLIIIFCVNFAFAAEEVASPEARMVKEMVDAAYAFVVEHSGNMDVVQKALEEDTRFIDHSKKIYIFLHCYDSVTKEVICCGQGKRPELVGKKMSNLRTPNGRLLFQEMIERLEMKGDKWFEYEWLNPYTKNIQTKRSYVRKIVLKDGRHAWIGSGYWKK